MKKLTSILLTVLILLTLTSCIGEDYSYIDDVPKELPAPQTREELYSLYNQIERSMTKSEVESLLGEGELSYNEYNEPKFTTYHNETKSAGVTIIYNADNVVETKTLFFNTKRNLIPFSGRFDTEKIEEIKNDSSIASATEILSSEPLELSCTYGNDGPQDEDIIYGWYNEDASNLLIHTETGLITNVVFYSA